jgi:hypothetical protein
VTEEGQLRMSLLTINGDDIFSSLLSCLVGLLFPKDNSLSYLMNPIHEASHSPHVFLRRYLVSHRGVNPSNLRTTRVKYEGM